MAATVVKCILTRYNASFRWNLASRSCNLGHQVRSREGLRRRPFGSVLHECSMAMSTTMRVPCADSICVPKYAGNMMFVRNMAGHSKWQNIRHIKAAKDAEKSALSQKYSRLIRAVLRDGGNPDPNLNPKLGQIVEQAMKQYVPKATIENAIKSSVKSKEALESATLEIKGPGGCFLILELLTDNIVRSKQTVRSVLNKTRSSMLNGSAKHFFEHKGVINVKLIDGLNVEKATEDAIEAGAEDVREEVDEDGTSVVQFLADPVEFYKVKKNLEEKKYDVYSSGVKYLPCVKHKLRDDDLVITEKLYDLLEKLPEVVNIYDNIE